jgi:hypothetical protein
VSMDHGDKPVPEWQLERLALGELDEATAADLRGRLGPERTRELLARLEASNEEVLARIPPARVAKAVRRRAGEQRRPTSRRLVFALVPLAAVGLLVVTLGPLRTRPLRGTADEVVLSKGATRLLAYRATAAGPVRLGEAAVVHPHEVVQLAYAAGGASFGVIVSVDGRGAVTQHLPAGASSAPAPLSPAGEVRLPRSFELDDAPGFERFFLVTAAHRFSPADVLAAARTLARDPDQARLRPLALPPDLTQQSLLLQKPAP